MISQNITKASDIRQSNQWAKYMQSIGWIVEKVDGISLFIKKIPLLNVSMIKIQHPSKKINFTKIDAIAKKYRALAVIIEPHNLVFDQDDYKKYGYRNSKLLFAHTCTYKIDLNQSEEKLLESFSENARRSIKKAEKFDLRVDVIPAKKGTQDHNVENFYNLMRNLEKIKKIYALPKDEYLKKVAAFKDNSIFLFAYPKNSNQPIAALWLSTFNKVITYMQTGITADGYKTSANYLLVWEGIKWAEKNKIDVWDFDAVFDERFPKEHPQWKGFSEFKSRFHGEFIDYPTPQIKIYNPVFKIIYNLSTLFSK